MFSHLKLPAVAAALVLGQFAWADAFVFDPTTNGRVELPPWMTSRPVALASNHAELLFDIVPVAEDDDLAITTVFVEESGAYLSVYWEPDGGSRQLMCANLFENIGLPNERTVLINRPTLGGPGKLILQSSSRVLNILRVRLDWVRPGVVRLVDSIPNGALITTGGKLYAPEEVDGSPITAILDTWEGRILTTSITDTAERIEQGVAYPVKIPVRAKRARLEVLVSGLDLSDTISLWLNGQLAGSLAMEVPDLADPGFSQDPASGDQFSGWRKGELFIPAAELKKGDNVFEFQGPPNTPLAIRDFLLQIWYAAH